LKSSHYCDVLIVVQMNLGTMLQEGDGCTRDVTEFKRWCVRALNAALCCSALYCALCMRTMRL